VKTLFAENALLPSGWAKDVALEIDEQGNLASIVPGSPPSAGTHVSGPVLPGMPNAHSHAFQRALAGRIERAGAENDSFWSWREKMYELVAAIDPDDLEALAAAAYLEMLRGGFTAVGEFHYLHNTPSGKPYARRSEMSLRILSAAERTGIGCTLLPVLYATSGFGGAPPAPRQGRFVNDLESYLEIWDDAARAVAGKSDQRLGAAPHSLRAVLPEQLQALVATIDERDSSAPFQLHVSEQRAEVEACRRWSGRTPVEWLAANVSLSPRWTLVHATHATEPERAVIALSEASVALCPTTEANLGDGIFPTASFVHDGGRYAIGSDGHMTIGAAEELRWLEYLQRLTVERRCVLAEPGTSTGETIYAEAAATGGVALGRKIGALLPGYRADLVVLDESYPLLAGRSPATILDSYIFAAGRAAVRDVMVGGRWVIEGRAHRDEIAIVTAARRTGERIFGDS
jgi:formimidoylglutamate deiminase